MHATLTPIDVSKRRYGVIVSTTTSGGNKLASDQILYRLTCCYFLSFLFKSSHDISKTIQMHYLHGGELKLRLSVKIRQYKIENQHYQTLKKTTRNTRTMFKSGKNI